MIISFKKKLNILKLTEIHIKKGTPICDLTFNIETAKIAGKKSIRGPSRVFDPNIKEKNEIHHESIINHLVLHQQEFSMPERVILLKRLQGFIFAKTMLFRDEFAIQKLIERENTNFMDIVPHP